MPSLDYLWANFAFRNSTQAEELLRPELENGNLHQRDFDAMVHTFPLNRSSSWKWAFGLGSAFALWGSSRRPRMAFGRMFAGSAVVGAFAYTSAWRYEMSRQMLLLTQLEDPEGFSRAMENVRARTEFPRGRFMLELGKFDPRTDAMVWARPAERSSSEESSEARDTDFQRDAQSELGWTSSEQPKTERPSPPSKSTEPGHSRWDDIRVANAVKGRNSSWDALRQAHERPRVPSAKGRHEEFRTDGSELERASLSQEEEQRRFDAMIEEERRKNQG